MKEKYEMSKVNQILKEMAEYLDPSLNIDNFMQWLDKNLTLRDNNLMLDIRHDNSGIIYIRNKRTGAIQSKFKISVLDKRDNDIESIEEEEEDNLNVDNDIDKSMLDSSQINNLTNIVANDESLQNAGMGDISNQAKDALNTFRQASISTIERTNKIAKEILNRNEQ